MTVVPKTIFEGERTEAFVCRIAVERVCPVAVADCVEVFVDGNVGSDVVK